MTRVSSGSESVKIMTFLFLIIDAMHLFDASFCVNYNYNTVTQPKYQISPLLKTQGGVSYRFQCKMSEKISGKKFTIN